MRVAAVKDFVWGVLAAMAVVSILLVVGFVYLSVRARERARRRGDKW